MEDLTKEIWAYALQNALEFGKADAGKIMPKLFQHGLDKKDIKEILPQISEIVSRVNEMPQDLREKEFEKLKKVVKHREERSEGVLPELPGIEKGKKPVFRLAPFPSGALHIGNAKTYLLNALYAEKYGGQTLLVMDDTIGSAEKPALKEAYNLIEEGFQWLNVKYKKPVIYKSDRLKIYYEHAKKLIEKNKAYVCYCKSEALRENREKGAECSCRQYPPGIQLARWKEMSKVEEGGAVLRIKTDMQHPNPAFRDRVLFRITDRQHPRVGKKYRVWPTLEMTWAIDDHLLGITHVIRGNDLMIESDMEKYIWNIFKWKSPELIHTGLINIEGLGAKMSKSKAQKEVLSGEFAGWDDPRTWSLQSLQRRGIRPEAIREFVKSIGLNKQDITVPIDSLYSINRKMIDRGALRYYFVEDPIPLKLKTPVTQKEIEVPIHPDMPEKIRKIRIGSSIYIPKKDFEANKGKEVRLLHLFNIHLGETSKVTSVDNKKIPKVQWVSENVLAKVLMPDGKWINGLAESSISKLKKGDIIQFERFGFVKYDRDRKDAREFWFAHM